MPFIIKHYKCPLYKIVKCKIFKIDSKNQIKDESLTFNIDHLEKLSKIFNVKNPIFIECRTSRNIETLNNPIM